MYRLEGKSDQIVFWLADCDIKATQAEEARKKLKADTFSACFLGFENNEINQKRIHNLINHPFNNFINELAIMFGLIEKDLEDERTQQKKGTATVLMAIMISNIKNSPALWRKLVEIIGNPSHAEHLIALNKFLKHQCVMNCMAVVIEEYLKSLCELDGDFFVREVKEEDKKKLFSGIEVRNVILIINHLLNQPETSSFFNEKVFKTFELSHSFIGYLKSSMRNLNL